MQRIWAGDRAGCRLELEAWTYGLTMTGSGCGCRPDGRSGRPAAAYRSECSVLGRNFPFHPDGDRLSLAALPAHAGPATRGVGEPDIGARTKTPDVWLLTAIEEIAASEPRLAAAGEAWRTVRRKLRAAEIRGQRSRSRGDAKCVGTNLMAQARTMGEEHRLAGRPALRLL